MLPSHIRNISIIAHIDHGKTTLTDRLMMATNTITKREFKERLLDSNPIEQERGITIKLAPVRMTYQHQGQDYTINLIDTPGHVDFGYEVSRSLAACEGAVLLVDATQGIQAQTLSNLTKAQDLGLKLIVALNKIDLPASDPQGVKADLINTLDIPESDIIEVSAKTGQNVDLLFERIITKIPPPAVNRNQPLRALVFNSVYHPHKGVIAFVKVTDGFIKDQPLALFSNQEHIDPKEVGVFSPTMRQTKELEAGQVGYIATGLKQVKFVKAGDTVTQPELLGQIKPLPGYKEPQPVVFMDLFPLDGKDFPLLEEAIDKVALNDAALQYTRASSQALGKGFRVGFLGALHAEIVLERVRREYNLELIPTAPTVVYQVTTTGGETLEINNPSQLPEPHEISQIKEPVARITIYTPETYLGAIMGLLNDHRADLIDQTHIGIRVKLEYLIPLSELIINFYDQLKSASQGYASLEYEPFEYQAVDAVKLTILINKEPIEALSQIVVASKAMSLGKRMVAKLKDSIPRQNFEIPIQAVLGSSGPGGTGQVIARETVKAFRKDVTAKLYGGDITRRRKLLEKQKKGKKLRSQFARVEIPQEAYLSVLKS